MEPSARALGVLIWIAVAVVVAVLVGCGWGWLASGGLLGIAEQVGGLE